MPTRVLQRFTPTTWLIFSICIWLAALVGVKVSAEVRPPVADATAEDSSPPAQNPAQPVAGGATLVGDDKCITCHADKGDGLTQTPHGRKADLRTPAAKQGCETCHGPGSKHVDDPANVKIPVNFKTASARDVNATCTSCHSRGEHALWDGSQHESRGLSCTTCHSVHNFKSEHGQLKEKTQPEVCASCHRDKIAKLDRSGHMPIREGKMTCTSCHNVHGTTNVRLLRKGDSVSELCTSCHADKRGPFLWEHAPSRDGCVSCHDPHGSSNDRMLVVRMPMLCQRCHVASRHPSSIYDNAAITVNKSNRMFGRSCVNCHSNIHGSNHPSGQFYMR
ncbi:MAG TPA: DmsE family decaheme c-type cytochrome [Vicinamibacterales bacterium]|nr:DmsE family decaheme c-type cytochrome [Vicinamibacterales bacterium]